VEVKVAQIKYIIYLSLEGWL